MTQDLAVIAERLRDDLQTFRGQLRRRYSIKAAQVQPGPLRRSAASLAESGLVDLTGNPEFSSAVGAEVSGDLGINFQRLLSASEKSATRATYEYALSGILREFAARVVIPLKQAGARPAPVPVTAAPTKNVPSSVFLGHSFDPKDKSIVDCVREAFWLLDIDVVTGERPRADRISEKVKRLIDRQPVFVGLYTRRDKIARKRDWTVSPWVVEEKAYAVAKRKKLVLIKEDGISSIGGIQGDYEYIEFRRDQLHALVFKIIGLFAINVTRFAD